MSSRTEQCHNGCGQRFRPSQFWQHVGECPALWAELSPLLDNSPPEVNPDV